MKKSLSSFFSSESIVFIDESEQSDILISDCYEKDYPNENFFYFDNPLDKNEWQSLLKYVSNKLYETIFYKQI
ncbi:hypothetical protein IGL98_000595 [Enterococcus sp. DIV0840]|uniref:hypothetical protein n=1 Tax=Enterococcus ureasiticus TaxID=903984 RepID=UPI001F5E56DB|nr:hypothetical protein [Enterococcus ureasiticus]